MKVDLTKISEDEFSVQPTVIAGEICYLINPQPWFHDWTQDNLHFRSSVWNSEGELISASYKKFFNLEEKPAIDPIEPHLSKLNFLDKLDGSTLIVSKYKGELILRTRGTVSYKLMPNAKDVPEFLEKYKQFFSALDLHETLEMSYIFEWVSPGNVIVLRYGSEPKLYLTNVISHNDYTLTSQVALDGIAKLYGLERPSYYQSNNISELVNLIKDREDIEGCCVYYNNDQNIRKVKSLVYLKLHAYRTNLSLKSICELFIDQAFPSRSDFEAYIESTFDFESLQASEQYLNSLFEFNQKMQDEITVAATFVSNHQHLAQKDFAVLLQKEHTTSVQKMCFCLRSKGKIPEEFLGKRLLTLVQEGA